METRRRWTRHPEPIRGTPVENGHRDEYEPHRAEHTHLLARRAQFLITFFFVLLLLVGARLAQWQLLGPELDPIAVSADAGEITRGRIIDRSGVLLATDGYAGSVYIYPQQFRDAGIRNTLAISVMTTLQQPLETILPALESNERIAVLTRDASGDQCIEINNLRQHELVWCDVRHTRVYPQGPLAAHVLGFTNYTREGVYGVEASYDAWLRSDGDWRPQGFPSAPQPLPESWKLYLPSAAGRDLVLNLDAPLQYMVEKQLRAAVAYYQAEAGTVILMDPRTGAVLAQANYPTFDPNHYSDVNKDTWVNPAISQIYEPGSVMKLVTMAGGIDSGAITPETYFLDEGSLTVGGQIIHNAEGRHYDNVTATEALAKSINVVSAKISLKMGVDTFYNYVRQFGFGKVTEVDLRMETPGILKEPGSPLWSPFDQATNSFGQGVSVTTFQMVNAVAAIANKGVMLQPQIARGVVKDGQIYLLPARTLGHPIKPETARKLTEMMIYTVESSSAPTPVPGYRVAGKTGTAEIPTKEGYTSQDVITTFVGFLPAADPRLVALVKLVKPKRYLWAEQVVVPVFSEIAKEAVQILEIKPDDRMP